MNNSTVPSNMRGSTPSFQTFLKTYRAKLHQVLHVREDIDRLSLRRGLPPHVLRDIRACDPLSVYIPKEYGGRGGHIHEGLAVLAATSYESLALSLTFGINWALFLQPVAKYADDAVKMPIFTRFLRDKHMGGLMITEPDYGTDALNMQTTYVERDDHYHIEGVKHWGGLTGWADLWLVTARQQGENGLLRDIDFFICDVHQPEQHIVVEEYFENLGLYMIPYGRNRLDIQVPKVQRLQPRSTGILMMLDLLHRSRMQFPGMGIGFLQRLLDEAIDHCRTRHVGGAPLTSYDQVQSRLARLQSAYTVCSAMCAYSSEHAKLENDLSRHSVEANSIKSVLTDMMQEASQSLLQLVGAKGYRLDHIAGRATIDSRPFQIFEGSNDVLYQQISEAVLKLMRRHKEVNLLAFLKEYKLTQRAVDYFDDLFSFEVDLQLPQRKLVELGRALSRLVVKDFVLKLGDQGFRHDLIEQATTVLRQEIESLLSTYRAGNEATVVEDYEAESSWLDLVMARPAANLAT